MKNTFGLLQPHTHALALLSMLFCASVASANSGTWDGETSAIWTNKINWSDNT